MAKAEYPDLPYASWKETKETLHRFVQIVGKIRLASSFHRNHWWNVPFYVTARGITTSLMHRDDQVFQIDLDYLAHELVATSATTGRAASFPLAGLTVAAFYERTLAALAAIGVEVALEHPYPYDLADRQPFATDDRPRPYDREAVTTAWAIMVRVDALLKEFAARFLGKESPVHHFWHTFDLAVSRFSGREAPVPEDADPVTREAYSHELISFGFWFGDETFPAPAFYSYTHPAPEGLTDQPLEGPGARWELLRDSPLAVLPYESARAAPSPRVAVLACFESAYRAGVSTAGWDARALALRTPHDRRR